MLALGAVTPIASAAQMRGYAVGAPSAGEIYLNIVRGDRIKSYLFDAAPFSVPVLWMCGLVVMLFAALWVYIPRNNGVDQTMLFACGSRQAFWFMRASALVVIPAIHIVWRVVTCELVAVVLGGDPSFFEISDGARMMIKEHSPLTWNLEWMFLSALVEYVSLALITVLVGLLAGTWGVPAGFLAGICYLVASVFTCSPFLWGNFSMVCRVQALIHDGVAWLLADVGLVVMVAVIACCFARLSRRDFAQDFGKDTPWIYRLSM